MTEPMAQGGAEAPIRVERWPTEIPLLVLVAVAAAGTWLLLAVSMIGLLYALLIGVFLGLSHVGFIAYIRGSAVRLSPEQLPELHARVTSLARRLGLRVQPEAYLMQAGGSLNALATKFLRSHMLVLFSDLLDACGDNEQARDMIIGHELGHIRAGHLRWTWFLFPGFLVPFLGMAYSRAREYTCDRYGAAVCGDLRQGLVGLGILAAGGVQGRRLNLRALANQTENLNTGWMTIGKWLSTHPQLSERIGALDPQLVQGPARAQVGVARALVILAVAIAVPVAGIGLFVRSMMPAFREAYEQAQARNAAAGRDPATAVQQDLDKLARFALAHKESGGSYPSDEDALAKAWQSSNPRAPLPIDPYDGKRYGYLLREDHFILWSAGPDKESGTDDDLWLDSRDVTL